MKKYIPLFLVFSLVFSSCVSTSRTSTPSSAPTGTQAPTATPALPLTGAQSTQSSQPASTLQPTSTVDPIPTAIPGDTPTATLEPIPTLTVTATAAPGAVTGIPDFQHIVVIVFENRDYNEVIGNPDAPYFNQLANQNVLFTNYYAVTHPSLPNYIALISGSTLGIANDCNTCYRNKQSLPNLIDASGRTWKDYQESMPSPCYTSAGAHPYDLQHNPFIYFDSIRQDAALCDKSVVPMTQLTTDLQNNQLPNYAFIMPNLCDSAHSCSIIVADQWLKQMMGELQSSSALGSNSAIFIVFDESSSDNSTCCGLSGTGGGKVTAILVSPQAKSGFQDNTPLNHYSLLKTILLAWNLPLLNVTKEKNIQPITAPWK